LEKACLTCGNALENPRRKTCPGECEQERLRKLRREYRERKKTGRSRECSICGGAIPSRPGAGLTCSEECGRIRDRERKREYYHRHRDEYRERARAWRKTEAGRAHSAREYNKRRRLLEGAVQVPWLRSEIAERDGWECYLCGSEIEPDDLNIDHVKPLSLGGDDAPWNVAATHAACNFSKWNSFPEVAMWKVLELGGARV